jgi:hypothetical protein
MKSDSETSPWGWEWFATVNFVVPASHVAAAKKRRQRTSWLAGRPILRLQPWSLRNRAPHNGIWNTKKWQRKISLSFLCLCRLLEVWLTEQSYWMTRVVSHSNSAATNGPSRTPRERAKSWAISLSLNENGIIGEIGNMTLEENPKGNTSAVVDTRSIWWSRWWCNLSESWARVESIQDFLESPGTSICLADDEFFADWSLRYFVVVSYLVLSWWWKILVEKARHAMNSQGTWR